MFPRLAAPATHPRQPQRQRAPENGQPGYADQGRQISGSTGGQASTLHMDREQTRRELEGEQAMQSGEVGSGEEPTSNEAPMMLHRVLMLAAGAGDLEVVQTMTKLLGTAEAINQPGPDGSTALICAAACGHLEVVQYLAGLLTPEAINHPGPSGTTALMVAAQNGHSHVVRALVRFLA